MIVAPDEILWEPITEHETANALSKAKKSTAPDCDGIPTLVWYHLWPYVSGPITRIFTASIDLGYHPRRWKTTKIAVLRKPVMAKRLSYYAEAYYLLPQHGDSHITAELPRFV